jgi:hypothetical protein
VIRRERQVAGRPGLRAAMAARCRQRAGRDVAPGWSAHYRREAARWDTDEPILVYRHQIPDGYVARAVTLDGLNALWEVAGDGSLSVVPHGQAAYRRWRSVHEGADPRLVA